MATGLTDSAHYKAIADAIRAKNGLPDTYSPAEMPNAISLIETGIQLDPLDKPATAAKILTGYQAYTSDGEVIIGEALPRLNKPATGQQILSGYEAYDANGNRLTGNAFITAGYADFTLEASKWNGTTYILETTEWRIEDGQTPLMDLAFTSSAPNAQRVIEAGIVMPQFNTTSSTDKTTGVTTYTTRFMFSAAKTPPVDVVVAVVNITAVPSAPDGGGTV